MVADIIESLKADLEDAQEAKKKAEKLIELGKEAGIDVSEQEARLKELSSKVERLQKAIEAREEE